MADEAPHLAVVKELPTPNQDVTEMLRGVQRFVDEEGVRGVLVVIYDSDRNYRVRAAGDLSQADVFTMGGVAQRRAMDGIFGVDDGT